MICRFGRHAWAKWEIVTSHYDYGKRVEQLRRCERCGKYQLRPL